MNVEFNKDWTYKEVVDNIEALKSQVWGIIASFSCFDLKKEVEFKRKLRDAIYSLNFEIWRRERILEFIYNDIDLDVLKKII